MMPRVAELQAAAALRVVVRVPKEVLVPELANSLYVMEAVNALSPAA